MKVPCSGMDKIASAALIVLAIRGMDNAAVIPPRVRTHNQNMTVAARAIADRNTLGQRS